MKVRAIATLAERSNAIGTVELECTPHGLAVHYLGLAAIREGYAPAEVTTGTGVIVPWASVLEARIEDDQLFLALDPVVTPHCRLLLGGFTSGAALDRRGVGQQRLIWRIATAGAALAFSVMAALTAPRLSPSVGATTAGMIAVLTAVTLLLVGWFAELRVGRAEDERISRATFVAELATYLPSLTAGPKPPRPRFVLPPWVSLMGLLPRTTLAVVITLSSGLLGLLLVGQWITASEQRAREQARMRQKLEETATETRAAHPPPPPVAPPTTAEHPPVAPSASASLPPRGPAAEGRGNCRCERAQSLLWADPVPKLTTLVLSRRQSVRGRRRRLEVDLAAINNAADDLKEIALVLNFYQQDEPPSTERNLVANRAVYYEGPLGPGQAIKWSVEARGTSFEIQNPVAGTLGSHGEGAAPPDAVATLLKANHRPVRLHGAMLLAYLGDPRAREAALTLGEAQREDEAAYLVRVLAATAPLRVCNLTWVDPARRRVEACVFNAGGEARADVGLGLRALAGKPDTSEPSASPPTMVSETKLHVPGTIAPGQGLRVMADFRGADPEASVLEGRADRFDLLD